MSICFLFLVIFENFWAIGRIFCTFYLHLMTLTIDPWLQNMLFYFNWLGSTSVPRLGTSCPFTLTYSHLWGFGECWLDSLHLMTLTFDTGTHVLLQLTGVSLYAKIGYSLPVYFWIIVIFDDLGAVGGTLCTWWPSLLTSDLKITFGCN